MIFVQIAAYRDPELLPTIRDCIAKAKYSNNLRFGICWQSQSNSSALDQFRGDSRFRIHKVDWRQSKGLCWARSKTQGMFEGEEFTLQIDSHHRFAKNWDEWLINTYSELPKAKSILSSYAAPYDPQHDAILKDFAYKMVASHFTKGGTIVLNPHRIPDAFRLSKPIRARFVSGHYFFTVGEHCVDYRYDPSVYFSGDELSLSLRSFTLGYDLYHPHRNVIWHEYTRPHRFKHWSDHIDSNPNIDIPWFQRDKVSKARLRILTIGTPKEMCEQLGDYGVGSLRTRKDYERYAGIDFKTQRLQQTAVDGLDPPCIYETENQWQAGFTSKHEIIQ